MPADIGQLPALAAVALQMVHTLDQSPMGSRLTPRSMSAAARSRRLALIVFVRSVMGRFTCTRQQIFNGGHTHAPTQVCVASEHKSGICRADKAGNAATLAASKIL